MRIWGYLKASLGTHLYTLKESRGSLFQKRTSYLYLTYDRLPTHFIPLLEVLIMLFCKHLINMNLIK